MDEGHCALPALRQDDVADRNVQITLHNRSNEARERTLDVVVQGDNFSSSPIRVSYDHGSELGDSIRTVPLTVEYPRLPAGIP